MSRRGWIGSTRLIQLLGARRFEERHPLGLAPVRRQRLEWQAGGDHGRLARPPWDRPRAVSPLSDPRGRHHPQPRLDSRAPHGMRVSCPANLCRNRDTPFIGIRVRSRLP